MSEHPSQIMFTCYFNGGLRNRIEALVRDHLWNDTTTDPTAPIPLDSLAWAVATNPTIRNAVTVAIVDGEINAAIDGIDETILERIILAALTRLNEGTP